MIGGRINTKLILAQWPEIQRLVASIQQGTVTASLMLRKLASYPRQNSLALALRELGRIERTLFTLDWLRDPALRQQVTAGLNKGEAKNSLARAVCFNRLGEIRDRTYDQQRYRASGLNLVIAAIILWNTVYLERAVTALRQHGQVHRRGVTHPRRAGTLESHQPDRRLHLATEQTGRERRLPLPAARRTALAYNIFPFAKRPLTSEPRHPRRDGHRRCTARCPIGCGSGQHGARARADRAPTGQGKESRSIVFATDRAEWSGPDGALRRSSPDHPHVWVRPRLMMVHTFRQWGPAGYSTMIIGTNRPCFLLCKEATHPAPAGRSGLSLDSRVPAYVETHTSLRMGSTGRRSPTSRSAKSAQHSHDAPYRETYRSPAKAGIPASSVHS